MGLMWWLSLKPGYPLVTETCTSSMNSCHQDIASFRGQEEAVGIVSPSCWSRAWAQHWKLWPALSSLLSACLLNWVWTICMCLLWSLSIVHHSHQLSSFFREFATICKQHAITRNLIMVGNFNFHMDNSSDVNARNLAALLDSMDLHRYVAGLTHQNGHTLDLLIARASDHMVLAGSVATADFLFDHCAIACNLQVPESKSTKRFIQYRILKCIHHAAYQGDLLQSSLPATPNDTLTTFLGHYSTDIAFLLDKRAPLKERLLLVRA